MDRDIFGVIGWSYIFGLILGLSIYLIASSGAEILYIEGYIDAYSQTTLGNSVSMLIMGVFGVATSLLCFYIRVKDLNILLKNAKKKKEVRGAN